MATFPPNAIIPWVKGLSAIAPMLKETKFASMCLPCARGSGVAGVIICSSEGTSGNKGGGKKRTFPALAGRPKTCFCAGVRLSSHAHSAMGLSVLYHSDARVKGVCVQMKQSAPALAKSSAISLKTFPACPLVYAKVMQAPVLSPLE